MEDLVEWAVERTMALGASYAEARYQKNEGVSISMKNGEIEELSLENDEGMGIRVLVDGAVGFASTNIVEKKDIKTAVERAVQLAKGASQRIKRNVRFSDEQFHRAKYEVLMKRNIMDVGTEEKIEDLKRIEKHVLDSGVNTPMRFLVYRDWIEHRIFANSEGGFVESIIPRVSTMYNIVVVENGKMAQAPFVERGMTGGYEVLNILKPWNDAEEDVRALKNLLEQGTQSPEGKVDVVISPEVAGIAVHESVGHPYESDRIFGREAAQAGESFVKPSMLGSRIGSEVVNVIEDPTLPGSWGFYMYDDEGVRARPRYLIKDGIITEFLLNREYASVLGLKSNAAARAVNYNREPIVRMANTYLASGDYSFDELIEDVKLGVYIKSFNEWNIDDRRYQQRYIGREAYLIENGELKNPVFNPTLEITTAALWSSVDAVGKDIKFYPGTCGKGEPMQGVPVWMGGAHARLRNIQMRR